MKSGGEGAVGIADFAADAAGRQGPSSEPAAASASSAGPSETEVSIPIKTSFEVPTETERKRERSQRHPLRAPRRSRAPRHDRASGRAQTTSLIKVLPGSSASDALRRQARGRASAGKLRRASGSSVQQSADVHGGQPQASPLVLKERRRGPPISTVRHGQERARRADL